MERKTPNNSRVELLFSFGSHTAETDLSSFDKLVHDFSPHVVCTENAFGTIEGAHLLENDYLQKHRAGITHSNRVGFIGNQEDVLLKNKVPRIFMLERRNLTTAQGASEALHDMVIDPLIFRTALSLFITGHADDAVDTYTAYMKSKESGFNLRYGEMRKSISNLHSEIIHRYPELVNESKLKILVRYGAFHTPLFKYALSQSFSKVSRSTQPTVYQIGFSHQRGKLLGKTRELTSDELAQGFASAFFNTQFHTWTGGSTAAHNLANVTAATNIVARKITLEKLRRIADYIKDKEKDYTTIKSALEREGIKIPNASHEGIKEFLARNSIPYVDKKGIQRYELIAEVRKDAK